jgi:hypothetical protein
MNVVPLTSPPDLSPSTQPRARLPRRSDTPGTELQLLILALDRHQVAAVDLASGALVRAWSPEAVDLRLRAYDVVAGTLDDDPDRVPDPSEPEAIGLVEAPKWIGRLAGRRVQRYLRPLVHPSDQPLLGAHAPAVAFWERRADYPSIAIVEPEGTAVVARQGRWLDCWFGWKGVTMQMPFLDARISRRMARTGHLRMAVGRGERLLIALTPPIDGHCHKVVAGLLPRP